MVFATLLLLSPLPLFGDAVLPAANAAPAAVVSSSSNLTVELPEEFLKPGVEAPALSAEFLAATAAEPAAPAAIEPGPAIQPVKPAPREFMLQPVKAVSRHSYDSRTQKLEWYGLMIAAHAGAAMDAWSTRRALSGNWGIEADPLMRPFAHSNGIYVATQVGPLLMDLVGRRAMVSDRFWVRKLWFLPQSLSATMSFQAATHNIGVVH